jgi:hypothetical protein
MLRNNVNETGLRIKAPIMVLFTVSGNLVLLIVIKLPEAVSVGGGISSLLGRHLDIHRPCTSESSFLRHSVTTAIAKIGLI